MLTVLNCLLDSLLGVLFSAGTALAALLAHRRADRLGEQELRGGRERALCAARDLLDARGDCCVSLDLLSARSSRARFDAVKRAAAGSVACPCAGPPTRPLLLTCECTGSCSDSGAIFSKDLFLDFSVVLIWPFVIGGGTQVCDKWEKPSFWHYLRVLIQITRLYYARCLHYACQAKLLHYLEAQRASLRALVAWLGLAALWLLGAHGPALLTGRHSFYYLGGAAWKVCK
jgi:hypothetical protein